MVDRKDDAGQVILTCAILLAIIIVIIALMLNNIIYATNVAYLGFMDGSKYEDISIKQMTIKEAARSYNNEHVGSVRTQYMDNYFTAINYLTNSKGKYVDYSRENLPFITLPTTETSWNLIITDKDSTVKYLLLTGKPSGGTPPAQPIPSAYFIPNSAGSPGTYDIIVNEGSPAALTVSLSNWYTDDVTITYKINFGGTATSSDITGATTGSINIAKGFTTGVITVPTNDDTSYEGTAHETFTVELTPASFNNAVTGAPAYPVIATVSIRENDPASGGGGSTETYDMDIESFTATRIDDYSFKVTAAVHNTGTSDLHNVQLELVKPTAIGAGSSPVLTDVLSLLPDGDTSTIYTWTVTTTEKKVDVQVKARASEMPGGVSSVVLKNVQIRDK
ncbi:hypothetical protein [Methanocella sp. MCL-LM]|uniref:hypothetical protein n=1 Tax=Methanocella sp. MCL-LM TaxID=3412035 RepID=UPI003C72A812